MSESKFVERVDVSTALWEIDDDDTVAIGRCAYLNIRHGENDTITIDTQGGWHVALSHQRGTLNLSVVNGTSEELSIDLTNSQGRFEMRPAANAIDRMQTVIAAQNLAIAALCEDELYECRCGEEPYTDGNQCPKCFAEVAKLQFDEIQSALTP